MRTVKSGCKNHHEAWPETAGDILHIRPESRKLLKDEVASPYLNHRLTGVHGEVIREVQS